MTCPTARMGDQDLVPPPPPPLDASDATMTAEQKLYWLNALQVVGTWSVHDDGDGRLFYYDCKADESQWEVPEPLAALEGEFMMKLMLQDAVARSAAWTAHDAGNGTLYYFNSKTRESKWERPSEWGQVEEEPVATAPLAAPKERQAQEPNGVEDGNKTAKKEKKKNKHKKHKIAVKDEAATEQKEEVPPQEEEEEPLTPEELQAEEERKARELKHIEQFRSMLRDKNIMPFCKWSVALPQIAGDPRFMGVPTMDERREIFEHFVKHRREDLKAEKKNKLKQAKHLFIELLREQFRVELWDPNTTLSVFISTLEGQIEPERYKQIQDNALALLTMSAQEKIYAKAVAECKVEALKRDGEQLRLTKFLEERLAKLDKPLEKWESDDVQQLVSKFYEAAASSGDPSALLSVKKQQQVFDDVLARMTRDRGSKAVENKRRESEPRSRHRSQSEDRGRINQPRRDRQEFRHSHRRYSRGHSRSRSRSRSESQRRERGRHRDRRSHRRSASSSRSRSRSRSHSRTRGERSSRRTSRHHRRYSSRSRSRSR